MKKTKPIYSTNENKRLFCIYHGIKKRCYNPNAKRYDDYGGRGIAMSDEWLDRSCGFDNFVAWSFENGYRNDLTLDRINPNGNYEPSNCRWITIKEQTRNKRNTIWVDYNGKSVQLIELCENLNLKYDTIHDRLIKRGWSLEDVINTPSQREESLRSKCKEKGLNYSTVLDRIKKFGWSEEKALNTPCRGRGANFLTYGNNKTTIRICKVCGKEYQPQNSKQIYCGSECRAESKRVAYKKQSELNGKQG